MIRMFQNHVFVRLNKTTNHKPDSGKKKRTPVCSHYFLFILIRKRYLLIPVINLNYQCFKTMLVMFSKKKTCAKKILNLLFCKVFSLYSLKICLIFGYIVYSKGSIISICDETLHNSFTQYCRKPLDFYLCYNQMK